MDVLKEPTLKDLPCNIREWIEMPGALSGSFLMIGGLYSTKDYERLITNENLNIKIIPTLHNNEFVGQAKLVKL